MNNALDVHCGYRVFRSGNQVVTALQNDISLSSSFLAVSLNASASNSVRRCFQETSQCALYSHNSAHYTISLRDYDDHLNERNLKRSITTLPRLFSPNVEIISRYKYFFATFGSHIITSATYGSRLQIVRVANKQLVGQVYDGLTRHLSDCFELKPRL